MPEKQKSQVYYFSLRYSNKKHSVDDFLHMNEDFQEVLEEIADKWIFQLEMTINEDGIENPHYQAYIHTEEKTRETALAKIFNDGQFSGCQVSRSSTNGINALKNYCMKQDSRIAGPWADEEQYLGSDLPSFLLPWQQQVKDWVDKPPNNRTINWICDPNGNMGKSIFCKYMDFYHGGLKLTYGNARDLLNLVCKMPNLNLYMFDLTRTKPVLFADTDMYSAMEDIKNGYIINTKYETDRVLMNPPHMVCFANELPKTHLLTGDRWRVWIFDSNDKKSAKLVPFTKKMYQKRLNEAIIILEDDEILEEQDPAEALEKLQKQFTWEDDDN